MNDRVLILGGAGFIGSHLVDICLEQGRQVVVYDDFSRGRREFLPDHASLTVLTADILDGERLAATVAAIRPGVIFHLAAVHYIPECEAQPARAVRINIEGTQHVLDAAQHTGARVVLASTGAIYDPSLTGPLTEESAIRTADVYGVTKRAAEELVRQYAATGKGDAVVARLFNAVGPRETNQHLIPAIMEQVAAGHRRIELGNLYPRRDYIHVQDVADGLFALGQVALQSELETFNVGSGVEHTVSDLVGMCAEALGEAIEVVSVPERRRSYDRPSQLADIGKITDRTEWQPRRGVRQAIAEITPLVARA